MRLLETALKAAGDPTRTRILKLLERGPLCVCQVQAVLGLASSTISKHLATLKAAGLVTDRRAGKWVEYALDRGEGSPYATPLLSLLKGPLDRDPTIAADRARLREVRAIPMADLCGFPPVRIPPPGTNVASSRAPTRRSRRRGA